MFKYFYEPVYKSDISYLKSYLRFISSQLSLCFLTSQGVYKKNEKYLFPVENKLSL